jgi:hypothetical protein
LRAATEVLGHLADAAGPQQPGEIEMREQRLLLRQRAQPVPEVQVVKHAMRLQGLQGPVQIERWTDGDHPLQSGNRHAPELQREVAACRESDQEDWPGPNIGNDPCHDLAELAHDPEMKDSFVEIVGTSVVPIVQAEHVITVTVRRRPHGNHVRGLGVTSPTGQQDHQASGVRCKLRCVESLQAHIS